MFLEDRRMQSDELFALHITWTCYGTRLPGDARGYVSNTLLAPRGYLPKVNTPGSPVTANDPITHEYAKSLQKWDTVYLNTEFAKVAAEALIAAAAKRGWRLVRGAIMADHIHVVIMGCPSVG